MDTPHLTIAEASAKTGRSSSTIRRLIKTIVADPHHPDRASIQPTPKAVEAFKKKGENFTWTIQEDVIIKNFGSTPIEEKKQSSSSASSTSKDILEILHGELQLKNQQIEKQWEVIQSLNDRLREGNILMGSLQQRLALPAAQSPAPVVTEASTTEASMEGNEALQRASKKKVSEVKQKVSMKASVKPSRRGLLRWFR